MARKWEYRNIGDTDYRKACKETNRWFETDFIGGFAALTAHQSHNKSIQLIHCQHPNSVLSQAECKGIDEDVTHVVSVLHGSGHFAVLVLTLDDKKLEIFDGLGYPLNTWVDHALHILKKCCLVDIDAKCCFRHDRDEPRLYSLRFGDAKWRLAVGQQFFKQTDTYNCGPIACLKIMDLYGRLKTHPSEVTVKSLRPFIIGEFENMVGEMRNELHVSKPVALISIEDDEETSVLASSAPQCLVCYKHISTALPSATMPCCNSAAIHVFCLETWAAFNSTCIFCRAPVDYSATGDNFEVLMSPLKGRDANLLVEMKESMAKKVLSDAMAGLSDEDDEVEEESPVEKKRWASIEKSQK